MQKLEDQIQLLGQQSTLGSQLHPKMLDPSLFNEDQQNDFGMPKIGSFLKVSDGNVAVITLGVIMSSTVAGFIAGWMPSMAQYAAILAGVAIIYFGKNKKLIRDFGIGVLIGGLAQMFAGVGSSLGGMIPGGMSENFEETIKETYGGGDGIYPVQPDRRVFA